MFGFLKKLFADDSDALVAALKQGGTVIDVRSPGEFASGSVPGAINIPHTDIRKAKKKLAKAKQPLILCCASGMRSSVALQEVKALGYDSAINGKTWGRVLSVKKGL
ncbi:rhodanese-like domain-containing protein [Reinekea sp. G2M2-21]|uniref:rhodanese-like domain-containing protein n=1 Tax=Reinekea sp. G2M2-21 TaxID=2788942 RepID=UPI0018A8E936|nr:rhodanese-like domain-containing protein [Reinekea sp. G2M2-21]